MTLEKWLILPGETRVIDLESVRSLKVSMLGGQVDVIGHDEPGARIEVHSVTGKDLRIEVTGSALEIDHPQLRWDNFLTAFRSFGSGGAKADISLIVPRDIAITLGVVSASALISGLITDAKLNTVSGDIIVDGLTGDLDINAVSGDAQVRALVGGFSANSVAGDVAATGTLRRASADTVSGSVLFDSDGPISQINVNTVNGNSTLRIDEGYPANFVVRSVSGKIAIDGEAHSGAGGTTNYSGSSGTLSGQFVDVRVNSVSGDLTLLRRAVGAGGAADVSGADVSGADVGGAAGADVSRAPAEDGPTSAVDATTADGETRA